MIYATPTEKSCFKWWTHTAREAKEGGQGGREGWMWKERKKCGKKEENVPLTVETHSAWSDKVQH